jgi:hypothetical protein
VKKKIMKKTWIRKIPVVIALVTLGVFAFSGVVMLLWNSILPAVFHISAITLWQAMGILLLSKILFGGFRGRRGMGGWRGKKQMFGKWEQMTPEERQMFSERMSCQGRFAC